MKELVVKSAILSVITLFSAVAVSAADLRVFGPAGMRAIEKEHAGDRFIVAVWSTDCPPCRRELSLLGAFQRTPGCSVMRAPSGCVTRSIPVGGEKCPAAIYMTTMAAEWVSVGRFRKIFCRAGSKMRAQKRSGNKTRPGSCRGYATVRPGSLRNSRRRT